MDRAYENKNDMKVKEIEQSKRRRLYKQFLVKQTVIDNEWVSEWVEFYVSLDTSVIDTRLPKYKTTMLRSRPVIKATARLQMYARRCTNIWKHLKDAE